MRGVTVSWRQPIMVDPLFINNRCLSFSARGVMVYICFLLESHNSVSISMIYEGTSEGKKVIDEALEELSKQGLRQRIRFTYKGYSSLSGYLIYTGSHSGIIPITPKELAKYFIGTRRIGPKGIRNTKILDVNQWTFYSYPVGFNRDKKTCGIYKIINRINGKVYIGQSICIEKRYLDHRRLLKSGDHVNGRLLADYVKYGAHNLIFELLKKCTRKDLDKWESHYFHKLSAWDPKIGYNIQGLKEFPN